MNLETLKYPVGKFQKPADISRAQIKVWIDDIEQFPQLLRSEVQELSPEALNWRYRPEGWTIKQVVHHCADSHINSIVRFKLTLTENEPTIKPYFEDRWAELPDTLDAPVEWSLMLLEGLHKKWVLLLKSLSEQDLEKAFIHPEKGRRVTLGENIALYSWHCRHHLEHVRQAKKYQGDIDDI